MFTSHFECFSFNFSLQYYANIEHINEHIMAEVTSVISKVFISVFAYLLIIVWTKSVFSVEFFLLTL